MSAATTQAVCRAALLRGPLTLRRRSNGITDWKFGRRHFSDQTVTPMIARGEAVRNGDVVSHAPADLRVVERAGFLNAGKEM